jgi:sulfotransferase family protein
MLIDLRGDLRRSTLVVGTGRSGTTWIGSVISAMTHSRQIFEPFIVDENEELALPKQRRFNAGWLQQYRVLYIDPGAGSASHYFQTIEGILRGKIRSRWTDRDARSGIYWLRVIKDIRANLLLPYIARTWPQLKIVWIVRDAVSVINSQLAMATRHGWAFDKDYEIVGDAWTIDPWLSESLAAMRKVRTQAEKMAHRWCIETMFPFRHAIHRHPSARLVNYDALVGNTEGWEPVSRLVADTVWSGAGFSDILLKPSTTSRARFDQHGGSPLHDSLSTDDVRRIERITESYGAHDLFQSGATVGAR